MAQVAAVAWFPRTYINVFETKTGLDKVQLTISDVDYTGRDLKFKFKGYGGYPDITFTQEWNGLHYFVAELPDAGVESAADKFMKDMQIVLLEKILKVCHTVTYKNIVADEMPLNFQVIALTKGDVKTEGYVTKKAGDLKVSYKPDETYYSGNTTFIQGTDDASLLKPLLYYAYTGLSFAFIQNMMKAMIRLYHEADRIVDEMEYAQDHKSMGELLKNMQENVKECLSRSGKMKHVILNFSLMQNEYNRASMDSTGQRLMEALEVGDCMGRLQVDGAYMDILWGSILEAKLQNNQGRIQEILKSHAEKKRAWL